LFPALRYGRNPAAKPVVATKARADAVKRSVVGTFHKVSAKYIPLYVAEFQFRYNNRENVDMFGAAVAR
jgi:predicted Holliday junction resolvase-like endonuclease